MEKNEYIILYVEDDEDFAGLNIPWFENRGYRVVYARDGAEAAEAFARTAPDLVLLDVMLPDMTGFEVLERIRETDRHVPVIFLTSLTDSRNAIKGLESGAYDYIRKQTDLQEIEMRIKTILSRTGGNNTVHLTDTCCIDRRKMAIIVGEKEHFIGYKKTRLLELLVQHKNRICERELLLKEIWGDNPINANVYLNQSIGILRRILSPDSRLEIKSFRNAGVLLVIAGD